MKKNFNKICTNLSIIFIFFLITLVLDIGYTKAHQYYEKQILGRGMNTAFRKSSTIYHHDLKPMVSAQDTWWGSRLYTVKTNSLGFRDRSPREVPLRTDKHRLLFIGDSITEGLGVDFDQTFVGKVQNALEPHGIEVLNAAVAGYSPIIYYRKTKYLLETVGLKFDELVCLIDISDTFDEVQYDFDAKENVIMKGPLVGQEDERMQLDTPGFMGITDFIKDNTTFLHSIGVFAKKVFLKDQARYALDRRLSLWTVDEKVYAAYGELGLQHGKTHMDALLRLLQKHHIRLILGVYPWPDQIYHNDLHSKQVSFWSAWAKVNNVPFIDLFPVFIGKEDRHVVLNRYYHPKDIHWNEAGHELVANVFLDFYKKLHKEL